MMKIMTLSTMALLMQFATATDSSAATTLATQANSGSDASVKVQDNLYLAVNGGWIKSTEIPADKGAAYGADLPAMADRHVRTIVDDLAGKRHKANSVEQKIGDYYASYLNTGHIDKLALAPVKTLLAEIDAIKTMKQLAQWQGSVQGRFETPLWFRFVMPDFKNPTINQAITWQGGLGLPDRDYYLKKDDVRLVQAYSAYHTHLTTLAKLIGEKHPEQAAKQVLAIEQRIALAHWDQADMRDPGKMYNPMTAKELSTMAPGFDWESFIIAAKLPQDQAINITQTTLAIAVAKLFAEIPLNEWKLYFTLHSIRTNASVLPKAFRDANAKFRNALNGTSTEAPRWEAAIDTLNGAMGEAIGQVYVARHFPPAHKARVQEMVNNLLTSYREAIEQSTWMSAATKEQALYKLSKYSTKIGYPDKWRDYSHLVVKQGDALGNRQRSKRFEWEQQAAKAGNKVDRRDWMMTPQTVNAYYDPMLNEIVFPAAFMQAPNFDMAADDATNYGAIGTEIGHEISHGFDNIGAQFDGDGVMRNWWNDADRKAFETMSAKLIAQYDQYEALPGKHINGKLTLPENIADLAGAQIAYKAYLSTLKGKPSATIDGSNGEQRFFLSWAQNRRMKARDELASKWLTTDPHAPNQYRINGAAVNLNGFHDAFTTKPGDQMYKPTNERVRIW